MTEAHFDVLQSMLLAGGSRYVRFERHSLVLTSLVWGILSILTESVITSRPFSKSDQSCGGLAVLAGGVVYLPCSG